jgi:septal ring factor EnvC (AmiA/AmiB activator)
MSVEAYIDWRQDAEYQGVQQKLLDLTARAKEVEQRTAQLQRQVTELEEQRIQIRANILLGDAVDSDASSLDKTLAQKRQELHDLEGEKAATAVALQKLQAALQQAESAAMIRVGERLDPMMREAVCNLHKDLRRCYESSEEVRRLHRIVMKQNLIPALAGDPAQKILLKNMALNFLNEATLRDWEAIAAPILKGR